MTGQVVGTVTRYYTNINVAAVRLDDILRLGDFVQLQSTEGEVTLPVESLERDHTPIRLAERGQEVGIKVPAPVREGTPVNIALEAPWP